MSRFFLSSRAESDILTIWEYIAEDNLSAADRIIDQFTTAFKRIAQSPEAGVPYEHPKGSFRFAVVGAYLAFYQLADDGVNIVRVLHSARRWESLL